MSTPVFEPVTSKDGGAITVEPAPKDVDLSRLIAWEPIYTESEPAELVYWRAQRSNGTYLGSVKKQGHFWKATAYPPGTTNGKFLGFVEDWFEATRRVQEFWEQRDAELAAL